MAASLQPAGASARTQTPLAAAVRAAVISPASMIARGSPVSASLTTIRPGMHASLGRHLNAPSRHRPVGVLDQIDLVKDGGKRCLYLLAGEIDERRLGGRHACAAACCA